MPKRKKKVEPDRTACVIYARFSSDKQRDESIEDQVSVCSGWAAARDLTVVSVYADRAISGTSDERPEFQRMMADAQSGTFATVVVYKFDRFSRNRFDEAIYRKKLKDLGVALQSAMEAVPDGPEGIILESVIAGYNEYYSRNLAQNVTRGMKGNAEKCLSNGQRIYGYRRGADGRFEIVPEEAEIVRGAFTRAAAGATRKQILEWLIGQGVRTGGGGKPTYNFVSRMLSDERYTGVYRWAGVRVEGGMPAIVPKDALELALAGRPASHVRQSSFPLSGRLFDEEGRPYRGTSGTSHSGRRYLYYAAQRGGTELRYPKTRVEEAVSEALARTFADPAVAEQVAGAAVIAMSRDESISGMGAVRQRIAEIKRAQENLLKAAEAGVILPNMAKRSSDLDEEKAALERRLVLSERAVPSAAKMAAWVRRHLCERDSALVLKSAVARCVLDGAGNMRVEIPWRPLGESGRTRMILSEKESEPAGRQGFAEVTIGGLYHSNREQPGMTVSAEMITILIHIGEPCGLPEKGL